MPACIVLHDRWLRQGPITILAMLFRRGCWLRYMQHACCESYECVFLNLELWVYFAVWKGFDESIRRGETTNEQEMSDAIESHKKDRSSAVFLPHCPSCEFLCHTIEAATVSFRKRAEVTDSHWIGRSKVHCMCWSRMFGRPKTNNKLGCNRCLRKIPLPSETRIQAWKKYRNWNVAQLIWLSCTL